MVRDMGKTCSMRDTKNSDNYRRRLRKQGGQFIKGMTHMEVKYSNGPSINTEIGGPPDGVRFFDQRSACQPLRTGVHTVHGRIRYLNVNARVRNIRLGVSEPFFHARTPKTKSHTPTNPYQRN